MSDGINPLKPLANSENTCTAGEAGDGRAEWVHFMQSVSKQSM